MPRKAIYMVKVGQKFNNYKELCEFLGETVKSGRSKQYQIKRWRRVFDFHNEGYKIIIDKVYNAPLIPDEQRCSNNHKNMDIYLPYIHKCLYKHFGENMNTSYIISEALNLLNPNILNKVWNYDKDFFEGQDIDAEDFCHWISDVRAFLSSNIETVLKNLYSNGKIQYKTGYAFISNPKKIKYIAYTMDFNDYIDYVEEKVCDKLNEKYGISSRLSGRQLKYAIFRKQSYKKKYKKGVLVGVSKNTKLMNALQDSIDEQYKGIIFGSKEYPIDGYWKIWSITDVGRPKNIDLQQFRRKYIDLIVKKTSCGEEIPQKWLDLAFLC